MGEVKYIITKKTLQRLLISFVSLLFLSIIAMVIVFYMDDKQGAELPLALSLGESMTVFLIGSLFMLYPILIIAFAVPFLILKYYDVNILIRALVYLVTGVICMIIPTPIENYDYFYIVIALIFALIDFTWSRTSMAKD
jgi:hypothetical protein